MKFQLGGWALALGVVGMIAAQERAQVDFALVQERAAALAGAAYQAPAEDLPKDLAEMGYDLYRDIRYAPERALWRGDRSPFTVQFFHRGGLFRAPVRVHEFSGTHVQEVPFAASAFDYGPRIKPGRWAGDLGFAGFRVHAPMNRPDYYDEVVAFLGASYFRAVAAGQVYGLSARGVAVDSGLPGVAEEFPQFTEFWLGRPEAEAKTLTIYALLDGPRVAGAYEFVVEPGARTTMTVKVALYAREAIGLLGVAPLTSMFWYGQNTDRPTGQPRPQVHDSDGLMVETGEVVTWRPLHSPAVPLGTEFAVGAGELRRFGLMQRERDFANYQDTEAMYHRRPAAWVEPISGFGAGAVRLVELPAEKEYGDNIGAFWVPAEPIEAGWSGEFSYRLVWGEDSGATAELARVTGTWRGALANGEEGEAVWIDFAGGSLTTLGETEPNVVVETGTGVGVKHQALVRLPDNRGWRVALRVGPTGANEVARMTVWLRDGFEPVSEQWSSAWRP